MIREKIKTKTYSCALARWLNGGTNVAHGEYSWHRESGGRKTTTKFKPVHLKIFGFGFTSIASKDLSTFEHLFFPFK